MSQQDAFDRILASLHEACFDDAHWPETSALIDEACRAKGNILSFGVGASQRDVEVFFAWFCYRGQRRFGHTHNTLFRERSLNVETAA